MGRRVNVAPGEVSENIFKQARSMQNEMTNPAVSLPTVGMSRNREFFQFPHFSTSPLFGFYFLCLAIQSLFFFDEFHSLPFVGAAYGDHGGTTHSYRRRLPHSLSHTLLNSARQSPGERNQVRMLLLLLQRGDSVLSLHGCIPSVPLCVACSFPAVFPLVRCALFSLPIAPLAERFSFDLSRCAVLCVLCDGLVRQAKPSSSGFRSRR